MNVNKPDKALALLNDKGKLLVVRASSIAVLRKKLKAFPLENIIEIWRGRKIEMKIETKLSF